LVYEKHEQIKLYLEHAKTGQNFRRHTLSYKINTKLKSNYIEILKTSMIEDENLKSPKKGAK
jgi:hypothetical protein